MKAKGVSKNNIDTLLHFNIFYPNILCNILLCVKISVELNISGR